MPRYLPLLIAALLSVTACTRSTAVTPLRIQLWGEPVSLDPALAEDLLSLHLLENITESLVGYDGAGQLQDRLAESHEVSADGKKLTFTLRKDAAWSDGKPVTAEQVVDGIRRSLSPDLPAKFGMILEPIKGAKAYRSKEVGAEGLGVRALDGKVIVELEKPTPYFIHALTLGSAAPIRKELFEANGGKWKESFPVNGPYRISEHRTDEKYVLERNPFYWKKDSAGLPKIEFLIVREDGTALNLFEQNQLDILTKVSPLDVIRLKKLDAIRLSPFFATYYLGFNVRKPPFDNRDFRRAASAAIRKEEIVAALGTDDVPARSFISRGLEGYVPFDPALKDSPLFAHATENVKKHPPLKGEMVAQFDSNARNSLVLEKVQQDLLKTLGIRIGLLPLDWKSHIKAMQTEPAAIYRFGWLTPFNDPIFFLEPGVTGDRSNYGGFSNARFDQLVEEIRRAKPGREREAKIIEAQRIWIEDEAAIVPIYHYTQVHAVSKRVTGYRVNPFGYLVLPELGLQKEAIK